VKQILLNLGAAALLVIPVVALLLLAEAVTLTQRHVGYFVVGYLALVLVLLLLREILIDLWRWWRER